MEPSREVGVFSGASAFENAQRMAKALATSDLVPTNFKNNLANCLIALEVSQRTGASVLAVMQGGNVIHGKWSWTSQYIIGALNSCGRFAPLRFDIQGDGDKRTCIAWTVDKSGERLEGPPVSIGMAKEEGWFGKTGSKWKTMPELMLRYRAASFFGRLYAPDVLLGMSSEDEVRDVTPQESTTEVASVDSLNAKIRSRKTQAYKAVKKTEESVPPTEESLEAPAVESEDEQKGEFF